MTYSTTTIYPVFFSQRLKQDVTLAAKCYVPEVKNQAGLTLLLFHCAGSHKEVWEPTLQSVFTADASASRPVIREAWSFDMPNHGEAATRNKELLERIKEPIVLEDWAEGLQHFLASGALKGHRLFAIGHSFGSTAMITAMLPGTPLPPADYEAAVIVEPPLSHPTADKQAIAQRDMGLKMTAKGVLKRRITWASRDEALAFLQERWPWSGWDSRAVQLFVRHALWEREPGSSAVTLCCLPAQETSAYLHVAPHDRVVQFFASGMDPCLPVHWVTGERSDLVDPSFHQGVMALRKPLTWREVPDAGHFVLQENPDGLAAAITQILAEHTSATAIRAHL
ncbi:alpha/beta-hydrolase [Lenzites betulinus]|nr:alpha/beta-hydrolase [Lenzites betulinus]